MKSKLEKLIYLVSFLLFVGASAANAQNPVDPTVTVSDTEAADLQFMREEEMLARDTYDLLADQWGLSIFSNIAKSEQKHTDAILALLNVYGLEDLSNPIPGIYTNPDLQSLYDDLTLIGMQSAMDALHVGAAIEETDIFDIEEAIGRTDNADIIATYENLMCGSRNHLRAFAAQIEISGGEYIPLSSDEEVIEALYAIVDSPMERGCGSNKQARGSGKGEGNHYGNANGGSGGNNGSDGNNGKG
jgi:hypothetical protein